MHALAHNPKAPKSETRAKPTIFAQARFWQSRDASSIVDSQRSDENQIFVRRLPVLATALPRFGADFIRVPVHSAATRSPSPQPKLSVNEPGDKYEQEADRITEQVVSMPEPQLRRIRMHHGANGDHHLQPTAIARAVTPVLPPKASGEATASDTITNKITSTRGGGSPLPESSRSIMESRFGMDFSHVRIHTGDYAARLSRDLGARAFTVGRDIYLGASSFSPESSEGRRLLAHELTHTLQQRVVPSGHLAARPMIQKKDGDKANTAFGEFEAVKYHSLKQKADGKEVGVEMFLKFNPGAKVDAKQIALTQSVTGQRAGTSFAGVDPNYGRRSATSGPGKGHFIDVLAGYPSPLYATTATPTPGADASKLTSYPTMPSTALTAPQITAQEAATGITGETRKGFGKHGYRYMDAGHLKGPEAAELYDAPQQGSAANTDATFESAALAIEGTQKDTYYGSVSWGFRLDAAGKFSMVPFKAISQGTPSVNFLTAASIWSGATEDFNWGVDVASAAILDPTNLSNTKATVTRGTALTWGGAYGTVGGITYRVVSVKDGPSKGTSGVIKSTDMAMRDVGRATVALPVPEIYTTQVAGAWMVTNPAKADTSVISKLAKGTRVTIMPDFLVKVVAAVLGKTVDPAWTYVKVADGPDTGRTGWVKKNLLTREVLGTR